MARTRVALWAMAASLPMPANLFRLQLIQPVDVQPQDQAHTADAAQGIQTVSRRSGVSAPDTVADGVSETQDPLAAETDSETALYHGFVGRTDGTKQTQPTANHRHAVPTQRQYQSARHDKDTAGIQDGVVVDIQDAAGAQDGMTVGAQDGAAVGFTVSHVDGPAKQNGIWHSDSGIGGSEMG